MAKAINLPKGFVLDEQPAALPGEFSLDEPEEKGFFSRVGEDLTERAGEVTQTLKDIDAFPETISEVPAAAFNLTKVLTASLPEQIAEEVKSELSGLFSDDDKKDNALTPTSARAQLVGKGIAGSGLDIIGEGLVSAGHGFLAFVPDDLEASVKEQVKAGWDVISNTDIGQKAIEAVKGGAQAWGEFKQENPQDAKTIESIMNIALAIAPAKVKAKTKPSIFGVAAEKVGGAAGKQIAKRRGAFVDDLITPKKTPKVKLGEVARTTEVGKGPFKRSKVSLSTREQAVSNEVKRIKGVTPKNTIQGNYNAINAENRAINNQLKRDVARHREPITVADSWKAVDDAVDDLISNNHLIVGNAVTTANKLATQARRLIAENPSTASGLLKARKEFDRLVVSQKPKVFDPVAENISSTSAKKIRNAMNDLLDARVQNVAVKRELKRQNLLFDAIENVGPKAAEASNWAIGRTIQNVAKVLPFRSKFVNELGALAGLGIVGASATFAPIFAAGLAATAVTVGAGKLILGPGMKKNLGRLLKGIDKAMGTSTRPSMIRQLRADRVLIKELIENAEESKEE